MSLNSEINAAIKKEEAQLTHQEDLLDKYDFETTISYQYLLLDAEHPFSFYNSDFNQVHSEEFPGKSDAMIYLSKVKILCKKSLYETMTDEDFLRREHIHKVSVNPTLKKLRERIFKRRDTSNTQKDIWQFALYTNKNDNRAPRILFFVGNYGILYILAYDPKHEITLMPR